MLSASIELSTDRPTDRQTDRHDLVTHYTALTAPL